MPEAADTRYVYSACCTWHGPIQEAKSYPITATIKGNGNGNGRPIKHNLPGCPQCGSPLYEHPSVAEWDAAIEQFMAVHPVPLYREWLDSLRTKPCRPLKGWDWRADYMAFEEARKA